MPEFAVRPAVSEADWQRVRAVRQRVFVEEQACPPDEEWDAYDAPEARGETVHHLLGTLDGATAAVARWRPVAGGAKLERFAVLPAVRGRGLGRQMIAAAIAAAREAGHRRLVLHAQVHLADLYRSFGFETVGPPFDEAAIEHVKMTWRPD